MRQTDSFQLRCAVRAAGGVVGDGFFAVRAFASFFRCWFREEAVDLFDGDEDDEGDDEEVNDGVQKFPIGDDRNAQFFRFGQGRNRSGAEGEEQVGEVNAS